MTKKVDTTIYPEVYSLAESLAILDKYKSDLTDEQYQQNKSVISSFAIENMYLNEKNILNLIQLDNGVNPNELIKEILKSWNVNE
ncbi:hypothetical protein [Aliarcobacter cryaerophilus]|jgi:hypothetical protein|uniref:hypothetical protein n=1 Tax=Aliarcobacter cryaerophilus TaxID=28198 RepID=UPI001B3F773B|nr:hypothetical protein [Aliarcobacter sp.]